MHRRRRTKALFGYLKRHHAYIMHRGPATGPIYIYIEDQQLVLYTYICIMYTNFDLHELKPCRPQGRPSVMSWRYLCKFEVHCGEDSRRRSCGVVSRDDLDALCLRRHRPLRLHLRRCIFWRLRASFFSSRTRKSSRCFRSSSL